MRNKDLHLQKGEMFVIENVSNDVTSVLSSNSEELSFPNILLISHEDFNNQVEEKIKLYMNNLKEINSKFKIFINLNTGILLILYTRHMPFRIFLFSVFIFATVALFFMGFYRKIPIYC